MKLLKYLLLAALSVSLAFTQAGCQKQQTPPTVDLTSEEAIAEQKKFDEFIQSELVASAESDYLTTHIYFEHPENYGIDRSKVEVTLGYLEDDDAAYQERVEETQATKAALDSFNRDLLSDQQKDVYDNYLETIELDIARNDEKFRYVGGGFDTMTGLHTQLPTLFADYILRDEQDLKDLIVLINDVKPYMDSLLEYTKKQAEKGTLMIDLDTVIEDSKKTYNEGENSAVLTSMFATIVSLDLSDELKNQYKAELKTAFMDSFIPAYGAIIETMEGLKDSKNNTQGLYYLENGKAYYELLFKDKTGTSRSIEDTQKLLDELAYEMITAAQKIAMTDRNAYETWAYNEADTGYTDFESMLADLNNWFKQDFPDVGDIDYEIKPLDPELAVSGIAAYFNIPAIDGTTKKQIRVNTNKDALVIGSLDTFSTVAHEGLPGHMYQTSYAYKNIPNVFHNLFANNLGYTEGYATYVEFYALNYLSDVPENIRTLQKVMSIYSNCLIAQLDIGIHYEGWSLDQVRQYMEDNGLNAAAAEVLYAQLQSNPGAFLSYYVGYAELNELEKEAKAALGDKFTAMGFHQAILEAGSVQFDIVKRHVNQYIEENQ